MFHTQLLVAVSAATLALTMPGAARAAEPLQTAQSIESQAAHVQAWLAETSAWSARYTALIDLRTTRLGSLLEGGEQMRALLDAGKRREARAWAETWAREQRAGFTAEYEAFAQLPTAPPPLGSAIAGDPTMIEALAGQVELRDRIGTLLRQTQASGESYVDLVVAASSGRPGDLVAFDGGLYTVLLAHLDSENLMLRATQGPAGEPNFYFTAAMIEANKAAMVWLEHNRATILGQPIDRVRTATAMRTHAAASREAATDLVDATNHIRRLMDNEPGFSETPLYATLVAVFESMLVSASIEQEIADQNVALARATEINDPGGQEQIAGKIETLVNARAQEYTRRQTLLATTS